MHRSFETQHVQLLQTHATHSFVGIILPHRAETRLVDACAGSSSWLAQYSLMSSGSRSSRHVYVAAASHAFVSQSGIVAVLKSVREHGLPDAISRPTLKRTRQEAMPDMTPLGPLHGSVDLQTTDGGMVQITGRHVTALAIGRRLMGDSDALEERSSSLLSTPQGGRAVLRVAWKPWMRWMERGNRQGDYPLAHRLSRSHSRPFGNRFLLHLAFLACKIFLDSTVQRRLTRMPGQRTMERGVYADDTAFG